MCRDCVVNSDVAKAHVPRDQSAPREFAPEYPIDPDMLFEAFVANIQRQLWRRVMSGDDVNGCRLAELNDILFEWGSTQMKDTASLRSPEGREFGSVYPSLCSSQHSRVAMKASHTRTVEHEPSGTAPSGLIFGIKGFGLYDRFRRRQAISAEVRQRGSSFKRMCRLAPQRCH